MQFSAGGASGHDRYEDSFNGPGGYAEPYVERYGIKSAEFGGREPLHPTPPRPGYVPTLGQSPPTSSQGSVMMVYGLQPDKLNCDKLFNLFCLYGNVSKVKFLKTKEGCAMIQMGDSIAVERCLQNLNNITIGQDGKLQLGYSKQAFLSDVANPYVLPDKSPSFTDFTGSKNNRFLNPAMANKNRIQPPSKIVHFFNTPPDLTEETVNQVFVERGIEPPTTIKLFPLKSERSSSGLIEFSSVGTAVAAIMECNHTALENSSEYLSWSSYRLAIFNLPLSRTVEISIVFSRKLRILDNIIALKYILNIELYTAFLKTPSWNSL